MYRPSNKFFVSRKKVHRTPHLQIQNLNGQLFEIPFVGLESVIVVAKHCLLAVEIELECRRQRETVEKVMVGDRWDNIDDTLEEEIFLGRR